MKRFFTTEMTHPYNEVIWGTRKAQIVTTSREIIFEQDVEFPDFWEQNSINIVASKYFKTKNGIKEHSLKQLIDRVVKTITAAGFDNKYFGREESKIFEEELTYILLHQIACFNSPVLFNLGVDKNPQCSACFILSIDDTMESILNWYREEGLIFKGGSGSGINLSSLRSSFETVGGEENSRASGPLSFMRGADTIAATIKSGGRSRRSAKLVCLNVDHPDIMDFIQCKVREESVIGLLKKAGLDLSLDSPYLNNIQYQNANNSIQVTDDFMQRAINNGSWETKLVTTGKPHRIYSARQLLQEMAKAAWQCADPGIQFYDTINYWHTCKDDGPIVASNPCSEYMFLSNSACNLASINLLKFLKEDNIFDVDAFTHVVDLLITAQDIIVHLSSYPTEEIANNSYKYRPLGLGYSNLGALLMCMGLPYDSDEARQVAASITSLMSAQAYLTSSNLAEQLGGFGYYNNKDSMFNVIQLHQKAALNNLLYDNYIALESIKTWSAALHKGQTWGFRNSQVTCIAPTGTISFFMGCDTTGIEPELSLVKYKSMVDGGHMKIINNSVRRALKTLKYSLTDIDNLIQYYVEPHNLMEKAPLLSEHFPIFDCALGDRPISWQGHVKMVAAVQPFLSGSVSKTVNVPNETTVEDIENIFIEAWKLGLKSISIYRDGSKNYQVLSTAPIQVEKSKAPLRRKLSDTRNAVTHKLSVAGHEGYLTVGLYEDGAPGEIFVTMAKEGSTLSGMMDAFATAISISLQYGVPLEDLVSKFAYMRFEPAGMTGNQEIPIAQSVVDYIFRWLSMRFKVNEDTNGHSKIVSLPVASETKGDFVVCNNCNGIMSRTGGCYTCSRCGQSSGCG